MRWTPAIVFLLAASAAGCTSQAQTRSDSSTSRTPVAADSTHAVAATPVAAAPADSGKTAPAGLG
ncbi:MAG TPA: hypothetical protein VG432_10300, partial [Gemmatimonadaceae bacterium]|nr:hypothetical protein [Gemmatimonadaceae bacterium]